jgi:hypothetical protein
MQLLIFGLLAAIGWGNAGPVEPNEDAMRRAFASDLADGVRSALSFAAETGGPQALVHIRAAHTDAFEIRVFRKVECRPGVAKPGHICDFVVKIDTVAGPLDRIVEGRFFAGPHGLAFEPEA